MINGELGLFIEVNPNLLKAGTQNETVSKQLKRDRQHDSYSSKISSLKIEFARSYSKTPTEERAVIHLRDLFLSVAFSLFQHSVLSQDYSLTKLTTQGSYFYKNYDISKFFSDREEGGLFSSISHSSLEPLDSMERPISYLERSMNRFWSLYDVSSANLEDESFKEIYTSYLSDIFSISVEQAKEELKRIEGLIEKNDNEDVLKQKRRGLLTSQDWSFLPLRILLTEYNKDMKDLLSLFRPSFNLDKNWVNDIQGKIIESAPPYGSNGFLLGLALQGLVNSARIITNAEENKRATSLSEFFEKKESFPSFKQSIANRLATTVDALIHLNKLSTYTFLNRIISQISYIIYQLSSEEPDEKFRLKF
jgi:hypothetical protein